MTPRVESAANLSERGYVVPQPATGVPGVLDGWVNWDPFERTPELQWPSSVAVFSRMDNEDSRVTSLLEAISLPICGTEWRIDPNGAPDDVVKFVSLNFDVPIVGTDATEADTETEDRFCWSEHLEEVAAPTLQFGHCVDYETEVLTQRGWMNGRELRSGDQVMTLNPETGLGEWQSCETVHHWSGSHAVRRLEGRSHSSVTTLNHKWITRDYHSKKLRFRTSAELNTNDRIIRAAPTANLPTEPKWSDAFVELVAWYWTEGQEMQGGGVGIWQSEAVNSWHCQRIREVLTSLFGPPQQSLRHLRGGWREETRLGGIVKKPITYWYISKSCAEELRRVAPEKVVGGEFISQLTAAQLRLFIETSIDADGHYGRGGARYLAQKDHPRRLDAYEMACSLLGIPWTRSTGGVNNPCTRTGKQLEVRPVANAQRTQRGRNTTDTLDVITDGVWCPQVPNRTWLARRRGTVYFTGNSVFEQVYRRNPDDGMFWIRKLAPRPQWTISKFNVAQDGGLVSITQMPPASTGRVLYGVVPLEIPINRLVVYTHKKKPGQWMGRSILRSAYKHWMLKDELMRIEAATARRNGMGLPVGTAGTNDSKEIKEMRDLAMSARAGMNAGAGLGKDQKLELLGVQGNLPEMRRAIEYHDKQIALSGLAHFLNLGDKGGSYALASVQEGPFVQSVQAKAKTYCRIANRHIVRDLVDINFGRGVRAPRLVFAEIGSRQEATAQALKLLVDAGLLSPDVLVERTLRQSLGLPPRDPKDEAADEASKNDAAASENDGAAPPPAADAEDAPVAAAKQGRLW